MIQKKFYCWLMIMMLFASWSWAGMTGKIKGKVIDAETGEGLPSVNVVLVGTVFGAATDVDGEFMIINIPPGKYDIEARMIGYKPTTIKDLSIVQDFTRTLDFKLQTEAIEGEEVVITASRPIVQRDVTASTRTVSGEDIIKMPVSTFNGFISNTGGAVTTGGGDAGVHIRGGRVSEVSFVVDGVNTNDPVIGGTNSIIDNNAIAEIMVITGGFNAEYGDAMSGLVNIVTKEGSRDAYSGTLEYNTSSVFSGTRYDNGNNEYKFTLGGPLFFTKKATFFISGSSVARDKRADRVGIKIKNDDKKDLSGTFKLVYRPINSFKMTFSGNLSQTDYHLYNHARSWGNWLKQTSLITIGNKQFNFQINHQLSARTFYEVQLSQFNTYTTYESQDGKDYTEMKIVTYDLPWAYWAYQNGWFNEETLEWTRDMDSVWMDYYIDQGWLGNTPGATSVEDKTFNGWYWSDVIRMQRAYNDRWFDTGGWDFNSDTTDIIYRTFNINNYLTYLDMIRAGETAPAEWAYFGDINNMYTNLDHTGNFNLDFQPWWRDQSTTQYSAKFDLTSQINNSNQFKFGASYRMTTMDYIDLQFYNANPYYDSYRHYEAESGELKNDYRPVNMAFYLQDKIEWEDLTLNPGLRWEYLDLDADHPIDPTDLDLGYKKTDAKTQFSPRLGISFAMSDKAVMYAHYGHFFQVPEYHDVFMNLNADISTGLPLLGNPNIQPQKQIAYEAGFKYALTPDLSVEISSYYKNVENLTGTRQQTTFYHDALANYTYFTVDDFAKIKGIELKFDKRFGPGISGNISYSFMQAKGTGSASWEFYLNYLNTTTELPKMEYPLEFDITHSLKVNLNYYIAEKQGPMIFGSYLLEESNLNMMLDLASGRPYTPEDSKGNPREIGSKRLPSYFNIDLRYEKVVRVSEKISFSVYMMVWNILDKVNVRNVDAFTGKPDDNGIPPVRDPNNYTDFARWGYADWESFYNEDLRRWRIRQKNPFNYYAPREIRLGMMFRF